MRTTVISLAGVLALVCLPHAPADVRAGVALERGDLVVLSGPGVVRVAAADSQQSVLVTFPSHFGPSGIDVGATGEIYVGDCCGIETEPGKVLRVYAESGTYTIISQGGFLESPQDVAVLPDGSIAVADPDAVGGLGAILRIDPGSGAQEILVTGKGFGSLGAVTPGEPGELYFLDRGAIVNGSDSPNSVYRLDLSTKDTTLITRGGLLQHGVYLTYKEGAIYLGDSAELETGGGSLIRVDPGTGAQTVISSGNFMTSPVSVAWRSRGCLAITDYRWPEFLPGSILCVDPATGAQSAVAVYGWLGGAGDLAVYDGGVTPARRLTWGSLKATYR